MTKAQRDIQRKRRVLEHAERIGNIRRACRYFGVSRSAFYLWKQAYETYGDEGLVNKKPCPFNLKLRTAPEIVEKILYLRRTYHLGPIRIVWYLERYHGMKISDARVYRILRRNGVNRLPRLTESVVAVRAGAVPPAGRSRMSTAIPSRTRECVRSMLAPRGADRTGVAGGPGYRRRKTAVRARFRC